MGAKIRPAKRYAGLQATKESKERFYNLQNLVIYLD
jgi:hypothetical protein